MHWYLVGMDILNVLKYVFPFFGTLIVTNSVEGDASNGKASAFIFGVTIYVVGVYLIKGTL